MIIAKNVVSGSDTDENVSNLERQIDNLTVQMAQQATAEGQVEDYARNSCMVKKPQ